MVRPAKKTKGKLTTAHIIFSFLKLFTNPVAVAPFQRVDLADTEPSPQPNRAPELQHALVCLACNKCHPPGRCRLKLAGVEHCGLCGLVHYGTQRTCPHLRSETQVARMLEALKYSSENRQLKDRARSYIYGINGDLTRRRKYEEFRKLQELQDGPPFVDPIPTAADGYPINGSSLSAFKSATDNRPVSQVFVRSFKWA